MTSVLDAVSAAPARAGTGDLAPAPALIPPFVTRSSSMHAADWGRSLSRALEYLTVRVVARDGGVESDALVGRTVTLEVRPVAHGVEFVIELIPRVVDLPTAEARPSTTP